MRQRTTSSTVSGISSIARTSSSAAASSAVTPARCESSECADACFGRAGALMRIRGALGALPPGSMRSVEPSPSTRSTFTAASMWRETSPAKTAVASVPRAVPCAARRSICHSSSRTASRLAVCEPSMSSISCASTSKTTQQRGRSVPMTAERASCTSTCSDASPSPTAMSASNCERAKLSSTPTSCSSSRIPPNSGGGSVGLATGTLGAEKVVYPKTLCGRTRKSQPLGQRSDGSSTMPRLAVVPIESRCTRIHCGVSAWR
eukprot:5996063-Prymnesium_polylepis.1